jgi:hypothetical protein
VRTDTITCCGETMAFVRRTEAESGDYLVQSSIWRCVRCKQFRARPEDYEPRRAGRAASIVSAMS